MEIVAVPAFTDNYIWLVHDAPSGETAVVDPGDAAPALAEAERRGWRITQVWNTHHHWDHSGGNVAMKEATGCTVSGPAAEDIPARDVALSEGSELRIGEHNGRAIEIPGHTLGHIALIFDEDADRLRRRHLVRDGLRPAVRRHTAANVPSLQRLAALPEDTALYCGHEYTLANARFAAHAEPDNPAIAARLREVAALREVGRITLPTSVAQERETNPFVRATKVEEFARLRTEKDSFRS